ncbi:hypothetical protein GW17_00047234 [Ensete ventricosum]|nr:hypothetical protein GW17_00047234 [Ensete ventricosum]RZR84088.1 hypothetical protein BHM03_00010843 [Ensete ventricosum]
MRLYRVKSFYAFLLRFRSEGSEEEGQPPAVAAAPQARTVAASPQGVAASDQAIRACCPRRDRKEQPPAATPQVAAARCKATRAVASP